jgi:hypothetical protein
MVKVRIRAGRGKGFIWVDSDAAKWTGEQYKEIQASRKASTGGRMVSSGRGTGRRKLSDIPEPKKRPEYKGTITSGRGTGKRKTKSS